MTDTLFRFVAQRPPELIDSAAADATFVTHGQITPVGYDDYVKLEGRKLYAFGSDFIESGLYLSTDVAVVDLVTEAIASGGPADYLAEDLGISVGEFLESEDVQMRFKRLWGSYYAQVVAADVQPEDRAAIADALRSFHFLFLVAAGIPDQELPSSEELRRARILVPKAVIATDGAPQSPSSESGRDTRMEKWTEAFSELGERAKLVAKAVQELRRNPASIPRPHVEVEHETSGNPAARQFGWLRSLMRSGRRAFTTEHIGLTDTLPWPWTDEGRQLLSTEVAEFLEERRELAMLPPADIVDIIRREVHVDAQRLFDTAPPSVRDLLPLLPAYKDIALITPITTALSGWTPTLLAATPAERGIRPLGMGDLLLVEQEILHYKAGEVAHIENVMASERRERIHRRTREVEELFVLEEEQVEESEKDLQTTERFELHNEAQQTIETEMNIGAGVDVTADYGPVTVSTHGDFALSQSRSESRVATSDFAREVVQRSVARLSERVREERTRRTLERFEEENQHLFTNADGGSHIRGVYRWVDKYYKARLINYGRRLLMEFVVPEPAAFYLQTQSGMSVDVPVVRPEPPTLFDRPLKPEDLVEYPSIVDDFIQRYNVAGVEPKPAPSRTVGASFAEAPGPSSNVAYSASSSEFIVPDGYEADGTLRLKGDTSYFGDGIWKIHVAGMRADNQQPEVAGFSGVIPVSVVGVGAAFSVSMRFGVQVTDELIRDWALDTYSKIRSAYETLDSRYKEALAAAEIREGLTIRGRNPEMNRQIEREELQRASIYMLTNGFEETIVGSEVRYFEEFDAMKDSGPPGGYPSFDTDEASLEGKIIQFFEQAFEWHNMTYLFYPYFWGRTGGWSESFTRLAEVDPLFASFLRAGAARIVVPASPAYDEAVLFYLETNSIWNGGEPPTIDDPMYKSIAAELRARSDEDFANAPECAELDVYPCLEDEWVVKVPTNLVWLQESGDLPSFVEDGVESDEEGP